MFTGRLKATDMAEQTSYEIRVREILDEKWTDYFLPFTLTCGEEDTRITGVVHDQAELFGILLKIRDHGLQLLSVKPVGQL
jgi:hypothetical protein